MNNSSTAQVLPVQRSTRPSFQIRRPQPQKPRKYETYEHTGHYPPEVAHKSLQMTIDNIMEIITGDMVVTTIIENSVLNFVLSCPDFTVSVVYNDLTGGR